MLGAPDDVAHARACIRSAADAARLFGSEIAMLDREALRVAHLDPDGGVIAVTRQEGERRGLRIGLGQIVREAAHLNSARLLFVHNHPGGDPRPSPDDHLTTRRIAEVLRAIEIELVDHLILSAGGAFSFRGAGLL